MSNLSRKLMMGAAGAAGEKLYVESVFSTFLYTGNGSTRTITNGIDLSGEGGLVWIKDRTSGWANQHQLTDTARGATKVIYSDSNVAEATNTQGLTSFSATGFSIGTNGNYNQNTNTYASWTFRKAEKFFDVVTWTGDGTSSRNISHSLGSTPGFIIVKRTDSTSSWWCWHRSISTGDLSGNNLIVLNTTAAQTNINTVLGTASSTTFQVGGDSSVNASGATYVAYLFAHDAGGFGDAGTDSVVSCGSYTGNGSTSGPTVTLGWEPQWLLVKNATSAGNNWVLIDNMRGFSVTGNQWMYPNDSAAEATTGLPVAPLATGFQPRNSGTFVNESGSTYIYIAIRRGPMKTPTDATKVFSVFSTASAGGTTSFTTNFAVDHIWSRSQKATGTSPGFVSRLTNTALIPNSTGSEITSTNVYWDFSEKVTSDLYGSGATYYLTAFRRAPGFFDVVAYTGTGSNRTVSHNLGVVPELMIVKSRSSGPSAPNWWVYCSAMSSPATSYLILDRSDGRTPGVTVLWNSTNPTSSVFSLGTYDGVNGNTYTYIAYLFATCPGVSKVGSYTGTGTTLNIDCGFTAGARFVMIKRTDSTGDWYVWDTARGIVSGNDPYLLINSTAAEVTSTDYIDPLNSGFQISSTAPAAINANGGSFIFLAIA